MSELIQTVLPWVAVLACPLLMLLCMRGMFGRGCHKEEEEDRGTAGMRSRGPQDLEAEIHGLKERLAHLEAERRRNP